MTGLRRCEVSPEQAGDRLDHVLTQWFPGVTRSKLQQWIDAGHVRINGRDARKRDRLKAGDVVDVHVPEEAPASDVAQPIGLDVVFEDEHLLVVNKPPGLVVHPGAGNPDGTMLNALLHHDPRLALLPRAGIVHRLDKDTSGLLVVARSEQARQSLIAQLQDRTMGREYVAIVQGVMVSGGTVDAPIGRHRVDRRRMAVTGSGKVATTHYRVLKRYRAHTLVQLMLESGRTHQIRVHMAYLKFPVLGDLTYGGRPSFPRGAAAELVAMLKSFKRQALHALKLRLTHPATGQAMQWTASVPPDMQALMEALARDAAED